MRQQLIVAARFRGPPGSGNGGYVCGLRARHINGPAEVTLRRPTPLDRPLRLDRAGEMLVLSDGDAMVAEARPSVLELAVPEAPSWEACVAASATGGSGEESAFAGCFSCGRHNPHGVKVWAGPIAGRPMVAAAWVPDAGGPEGRVPVEHLWAALDCPGAIALMQGRAGLELMTGRMLGEADADCPAGARYRVLGWEIAVDGRKHHCGTAVVDSTGRVRARARTIWIAPR